MGMTERELADRSLDALTRMHALADGALVQLSGIRLALESRAGTDQCLAHQSAATAGSELWLAWGVAYDRAAEALRAGRVVDVLGTIMGVPYPDRTGLESMAVRLVAWADQREQDTARLRLAAAAEVASLREELATERRVLRLAAAAEVASLREELAAERRVLRMGEAEAMRARGQTAAALDEVGAPAFDGAPDPLACRLAWLIGRHPAAVPTARPQGLGR